MLVNTSELSRLAWLDSIYFDKEGFLFVRERSEGLLSWRNENYIERLCRLRGNILFILNTSGSNSSSTTVISTPSTTAVAETTQITAANETQSKAVQQQQSSTLLSSGPGERRIIYILVLEEYTIKLIDEINDRHYCFVIDFGKNENLRPFYFTTISKYNRDAWVECIHLKSLNYLRILYKTLHEYRLNSFNNLDNNCENRLANYSIECNENSDNTINNSNDSINNINTNDQQILTSNSFLFNIGCKINVYDPSDCQPSVYICVYCKLLPQATEASANDCAITNCNGNNQANKLSNEWKFIGKTELITSRVPLFAKQFNFLPLNQRNEYDYRSYEIKFKVFNVIEKLTETRVLIGEAKFNYFLLNETEKVNFKINSYYDLTINSILDEKITIGHLQLYVKQNLLSNRNLNRPNTLKLGLNSDQHCKFIAQTNQISSTVAANAANAFINKHRVHSIPNHLYPDNSPLTPTNILPTAFLTPSTLSSSITTTGNTFSSAFLQSTLMMFTLDNNLFTNTIHRNFQFEAPTTTNINGNLTVNELMAESIYSLIFPQTIMNIFMNDEKMLMNCITYSLGEVKADYQRTQMRVLESHLRLVNFVTESINELYQIQMQQRKYFRSSALKTETYFQFVPINFHLQRCLIIDFNNHNSESSEQLQQQQHEEILEQQQQIDIEDENEHNYHILNIYTVGAFTAHFLGHELGGLNHNDYDNKTHPLYRVNKAMRSYLKIISVQQEIEFYMKKLLYLLNKQHNGENQATNSYDEQIKLLFKYIQNNASLLEFIMDQKEIEETLLSLETLRCPLSTNLNTLMKRTDSMPLQNLSNEGKSDAVTKLPTSASMIISSSTNVLNDKCNIKRHNSVPIDEQSEFEPIDLLMLNIKASLISISSKFNKANINDYEPSRKKLFKAIDALKRISSISYAIEAIKLPREQLEAFYLLRLRRNMLFSQALTSLVISLIGELSSMKFLTKVLERRVVLAYFEGLLSCYAEEIGMLQDMIYAIKELNDCVKITFVGIDDHFKANSKSTSSSSTNASTSSSTTTNNCVPRIEGNGYNIRIIIPISLTLLNKYSVTDYIECSLIALFFNIGINEQATLAETFGQVKLQDELNKENFLKLENFIAEFNRSLFNESDNQSKLNKELIDLLTALKTELWSNRAKNVRILYLMEQITYYLNGLRFTSCKSAKDRTSMAVTLEEVRFYGSIYGFNEINESHSFQQMLDTLRSEGTRRENTRKNIGKAKYAFNTLQVMTLPKLYRPPQGTYGKVQT